LIRKRAQISFTRSPVCHQNKTWRKKNNKIEKKNIGKKRTLNLIGNFIWSTFFYHFFSSSQIVLRIFFFWRRQKMCFSPKILPFFRGNLRNPDLKFYRKIGLVVFFGTFGGNYAKLGNFRTKKESKKFPQKSWKSFVKKFEKVFSKHLKKFPQKIKKKFSQNIWKSFLKKF